MSGRVKLVDHTRFRARHEQLVRSLGWEITATDGPRDAALTFVETSRKPGVGEMPGSPHLMVMMSASGDAPADWERSVLEFLDRHDPHRVSKLSALAARLPHRQPAAPHLTPGPASPMRPPISPASAWRPPPPSHGNAFVSYSRDDHDYVDRLIRFLKGHGVVCWIDEVGIDYGDRWEKEISSNIDTCSVFIVVMTPASERSSWVMREIARAEKRGKPILPLLLAGEEFFRLSDLQYEKVLGGAMPSQQWVDRVRSFVSAR